MDQDQTPKEEQPSASEIGRQMALLGAAKGGKARAQSMTPEERSDASRRAVEARWRKAGKEVKSIPKATHVGTLRLGDLEIPCAVLDDGTRLLSQRGVTKALTGAKTISGGHYERVRDAEGDATLPAFLSANNLKSFVSPELAATLSAPKEYLPEHGGRTAHGVDATLIPQVCEVWLRAREAKVLVGRQKIIAGQAEIIMRGLAHVGIIALVDEATGYQASRERDALAKILEAFIAKELRPWVRTFEPDFYQELFRLKGIQFKGTLKAPRYIGKLTNDLVYDRLAPGVREELNRINPTNEKGQRKHKNFQWLTQHVGYQKLKQHLASVTVLMKVFDDWEVFKKNLDKVLPRQDAAPLFDPPSKAG
jgi:ribosomal protein S25